MLRTECQFVGLPLAQGGGRAEAEALSDFSLLPESAERTGGLISDTPGYYKQKNKTQYFRLRLSYKEQIEL